MECHNFDETLPRIVEVTSLSTESVDEAPVNAEELCTASKGMATAVVDDIDTNLEAAESEEMRKPDPVLKYHRIALGLRELKMKLNTGTGTHL